MPGTTHRSLARMLGVSGPLINQILHRGEAKPGRYEHDRRSGGRQVPREHDQDCVHGGRPHAGGCFGATLTDSWPGETSGPGGLIKRKLRRAVLPGDLRAMKMKPVNNFLDPLVFGDYEPPVPHGLTPPRWCCAEGHEEVWWAGAQVHYYGAWYGPPSWKCWFCGRDGIALDSSL